MVHGAVMKSKRGGKRSSKRGGKSAVEYVLVALVIILIGVVIFYNMEISSLQKSLASLQAQPPPGQRLTGIDQPLNATELAAINNAPLSYFENAANMMLAGNLTGMVSVPVLNSTYFASNALVIGGKPSVVYIGAISCIYCGENRWAMALALSRFGNFTNLYKGYSSFGDSDVPTLYWSQDNYTTPAGVGFGASYTSPYINFFASDYESPIVQGFQVQPLSYFISKAPNSTYRSAITFMNNTDKFAGTPFTLWGGSLFAGADAVAFGNTTPSSSSLPLTYMTHADVLRQIGTFSDRFAWTEYAGADIYIAATCPSIGNAAPVCSLPGIKAIEAKMTA
jgi:hypothetical protein